MLSEVIRIHRQSNTYSSAKQYIFIWQVLLIYLGIYNIYTWASIINILQSLYILPSILIGYDRPVIIFFTSFSLFKASTGVRLLMSRPRISSRI